MTHSFRKAVLLLALCLLTPIALHPSPAYGQAAQPEYAKWGIIAMEAAKAKYSLPIVDYLHLGRFPASPGAAEERFKLWLKDGSGEFGVIVSVQFYTANDRLITVKFQETDRSASRRR